MLTFCLSPPASYTVVQAGGALSKGPKQNSNAFIKTTKAVRGGSLPYCPLICFSSLHLRTPQARVRLCVHVCAGMDGHM